MSFSSGYLHDRIIIARRADEQSKDFGKSGQPRYTILDTFWANAAYAKGDKKLEELAMTSLNTIIFRLRYHCGIDEWCLIKYNGKWYNITSCNGNEMKNEMQITATSMANQQVTIV